MGFAITYDLIVLDSLLSFMDGLTVCRELRARKSESTVLMLTARDTVGDRIIGLDAGADESLAIKKLLARIRSLARRAKESFKPPVLILADLVQSIQM